MVPDPFVRALEGSQSRCSVSLSGHSGKNKLKRRDELNLSWTTYRRPELQPCWSVAALYSGLSGPADGKGDAGDFSCSCEERPKNPNVSVVLQTAVGGSLSLKVVPTAAASIGGLTWRRIGPATFTPPGFESRHLTLLTSQVLGL